MTIVEYYLNLINEASINLQKAQKLITDTVCTECKKSRFKRGCTTCAVKRKKTFLNKVDYTELIKKLMYDAEALFDTEAYKEVDATLIEQINLAILNKKNKRKKVTEFKNNMNIEDKEC